MKKISYVIVFVLAAAFVYWGGGLTQAENKTFTDRFSSDKKQTGESGVYSFDKAHSFIGFKARHMGLIEVPGFFRDFTGEVNFDSNDVSKSTVNFKAMTTSIDTGVAPRDKHLRTADFFEVDKYPELTFKSTVVKKKGKGWIVTGDLTMKGVTKSVSIPFEIAGWLPAGERAGMKMGIAGETTINRRDFGVNWGSNLPSGIPTVSDEIKIVLQIEAGKAKEAPKAE
ncbi:MAG: YceI family protein [Pyrinomonadaceae bacterium]